MNSKVTFPELVDAVAAATESPKRVSELFLKELFTAIMDALRNGESVRVRGLGLFKLTNVEARKSVNVNTGEEMEIPSHRKVTFLPEKGLADAINAPFAGFDTVVLDDSLTEEELQRLVSEEEAATPRQQPEQPAAVPPTEEELPPVEEALQREEEEPAEAPKPPVIEIKPEDTPELADEKEEEETQPEAEPEDDDDMKENDSREEERTVVWQPASDQQEVIPPADGGDYNIPEDDEDEEYVPDHKESKGNDGFMRGFIWGAVTMFVFYLIVGGGYFTYQHIENQKIIDTARGTDSIDAEETPEEAMEAQPAAEAEQPAAENAKPAAEEAQPAAGEEKPAAEAAPKAKEPVYDEVTERQFLSKIATKHYGHPDFWVYIYEENRDIIKNPNTIAPGTRVVVPPAEKYGIDKNSKESLRAARKKIEEIEKGKK